MNICPACLKAIEERFCNQPGDLCVCHTCGEFLFVSDSYALTVATPDQLMQATPTRRIVLLKQRCAVLRKRLGRINGETTKGQTHYDTVNTK